MKRSRLQMAAVAVLFIFLLGGCGEAPYELTEKEEQMIVHYSAHIVGKHNSYQKDGLEYVDPASLAEEPEEPEPETPAADTEKQPEASPDNPTAGGGAQTVGEPSKSASLGELFGSEQIRVEYVGSRLAPAYIEKEYYAVDANAGKTFLIVGIDVTNAGTEPAEVSFLASAPSFRASVNGEPAVAAEITLLTSDFSTFEDTLEAGETRETVLLFQVADSVASADSLALEVSMNGENYQINLENL